MAQAAVEPAASGGAFIGRPAEASRMKRKTPSELRDEQLSGGCLKRLPMITHSLPRRLIGQALGIGTQNSRKHPNTSALSCHRVFPVKNPQSSDGDSAQLDSSVPSLAEAAKPGFRKAEKRSKNALRSVSELHIGDEKLAGSSKFDMDKVLKGFGARGASGASSGTNIQAGDVPLKSSEVCPSKITIPGKKAPLDLTLKTTLQFVSSSSVKWCHNLSTSCRGSVAGPIAQSFNVYTAQFVALFIGGNCLEKQSCNAYLSQSTLGMRSLLRKQTVHIDALSEVDNTTQSLLSFTGNKSVHGLYDVLLNYKSFLNSLSTTDVPVLYSPAPFQNGCLHIPEVICREMRKADSGLASSSVSDGAGEPGSAASDPPPLAAGSRCYSMEIKDAALPPWVRLGRLRRDGLRRGPLRSNDCVEPSSGPERGLASLSVGLAVEDGAGA
ncbi:hypothetical protein ZWY2020_030167 [Hordeum vulgare]|nr:hypothetical protein ZWY2020_030167 [Hordeum vulgare]